MNDDTHMLSTKLRKEESLRRARGRAQLREARRTERGSNADTGPPRPWAAVARLRGMRRLLSSEGA